MTEDRTQQVSNLCSLGPRPVIMTGLMRLLLIDHFSRAENIEHDVFRQRLWKPGVETGILIEDATVWRPGASDKRPAVIIRRNGWRNIKVGIGNVSGTSAEGFDQYTKYWRGSHTLFCLAKEGAEVEILAAETYRFLEHFSPIFRRYFNLLLFELMEVGGLSEIREATNRYAVPITVAYGWEDSWTLQQHVPRLKRIAMSELYPPTLATFH